MSYLYADPRANYGGGRRPHPAHPRPPSDLPSVSSSNSWAFPRSRPNDNYVEPPPQREYEGHGVPSLREAVERQNQRSHSQYLAATRPAERRELAYQEDEDEDIVKGLHMRHVLNSPTDEPPHNPAFGEYKHGMSASQHLHNRHDAATSNGDYVIEGQFQTKNCVFQTADDVGYLFGCGTKPQDELVFVYSPGEQSRGGIVQSPTAQAKERNLWYHQMHAQQQQQKQEGLNDVLFQIDKEYQTMQAAHDSNMAYQDFPGTKHFPSNKPRGRDFVVANEDEYASSASCSIASLMDYMMPNRKFKKENMKSRSGFFEAYHADNGGGYTSNTGTCRSPRKRRSRRDIIVTKVSDESSNESMTRSRKHVRTASESVVELQSQLKALVNERANQQSHASPYYDSKFMDIEEKDSPSSVERRRKEQESIEEARRMLQKEVAQAQQNIVAQQMNQFAAQSQFAMANNAATFGVSPTGAASPLAFVAPMTQIGGSVAGANVPQMTPMSSQQHLSPTYQAPVFQQSPVFAQNYGQPTILSPQPQASRQYDYNPRSPIGTPSTAQLRSPQFSPSSRFPNGEVARCSTAPSFEFEKSHALLSDLKVKNSLIRQDISRMKSCMSNVSGLTGPTVATRGYIKQPAKSPTWNHSKSAYSSNSAYGVNKSRPSPMGSQYTQQESLLQGNDETRSERGSQRSVESPSQRHYGRRGKRQPPSPIRTDYEEHYV